jgi:hypothetical protein
VYEELAKYVRIESYCYDLITSSGASKSRTFGGGLSVVNSRSFVSKAIVKYTSNYCCCWGSAFPTAVLLLAFAGEVEAFL